MYISPKTAINEGWITHPNCNTYEDWIDHKFVSPNAIDFTIDKLFNIDEKKTFIISEHGKTMRGGKEMQPVKIDNMTGDVDWWTLNEHQVYDMTSDFYVDIPEGVCCELIIRSTFSRNGIYLTSGIFDSHFSGHIGCALHNRSGVSIIGKGTRIGQIKFVKSDNALKYAGGYSHDKGTDWK